MLCFQSFLYFEANQYIRSGLLLKLSGTIFVKWKYRYVHITYDEITVETPDTNEKDRVYPLENAKVRAIFNKSEEEGFPFEIELPAKSKTLVFKCVTAEDRADWVSAVSLRNKPLFFDRPFASGLSSQVMNILYEDGFIYLFISF